MSFGAGHSQDMQNRMRQHRSQLASKKEKFKKGFRKVTKSIHHSSLKGQQKKIKTDDSVLAKIKSDLATKRKKEMVLFFIILLIIGIVIYVFVNNPFRFVYR